MRPGGWADASLLPRGFLGSGLSTSEPVAGHRGPLGGAGHEQFRAHQVRKIPDNARTRKVRILVRTSKGAVRCHIVNLECVRERHP